MALGLFFVAVRQSGASDAIRVFRDNGKSRTVGILRINLGIGSGKFQLEKC